MEKINIDDISPAEYNPRKISTEELSRLTGNLEEFGLVDPIIVNLKNKRIIGGHQRYYALQQKYPDGVELDLLKLGDIGWAFFNENITVEDENYEKALNISLNKISGEWELNKLERLLSEIEDSGIDNDLTGFKPLEFELYQPDKEIVFTSELFDFDMVRDTVLTCPNCNHKFEE